jgi:hypothetical protein
MAPSGSLFSTAETTLAALAIQCRDQDSKMKDQDIITRNLRCLAIGVLLVAGFVVGAAIAEPPAHIPFKANGSTVWRGGDPIKRNAVVGKRDHMQWRTVTPEAPATISLCNPFARPRKGCVAGTTRILEIDTPHDVTIEFPGNGASLCDGNGPRPLDPATQRPSPIVIQGGQYWLLKATAGVPQSTCIWTVAPGM